MIDSSKLSIYLEVLLHQKFSVYILRLLGFSSPCMRFRLRFMEIEL